MTNGEKGLPAEFNKIPDKNMTTRSKKVNSTDKCQYVN